MVRSVFRTTPLIVVTLALGLTLAACGKKPGDVTAPQGKKADHFPHTYPRTDETAPQPEK